MRRSAAPVGPNNSPRGVVSVRFTSVSALRLAGTALSPAYAQDGPPPAQSPVVSAPAAAPAQAASPAAPPQAEAPAAAETPAPTADDDNDIVVTGQRLRGEVEGN